MKKHLLSRTFSCLFLAALSFGILRADEEHSLILKNSSPLALSIVNDGNEISVFVPRKIIMETEGIYTAVSFDDVNGDGNEEIVMTHSTEGGVNACSKIYSYNQEENSIFEISFNKGAVCNYRKEGGYLISAYRDGSIWNEDIYQVGTKSARMAFRDSCVGCGSILRKEEYPEASAKEYLVLDRQTLKDRKPIKFQVSSARAVISEQPDSTRTSRKYLVRGDKVFVVALENINGEIWVKFRFEGKTTTIGWLQCAHLTTCKIP